MSYLIKVIFEPALTLAYVRFAWPVLLFLAVLLYNALGWIPLRSRPRRAVVTRLRSGEHLARNSNAPEVAVLPSPGCNTVAKVFAYVVCGAWCFFACDPPVARAPS